MLDRATNPSLASNTLAFRYDTTAPQANLISTAAAVTKYAPIPLQVSFSEEVTGFASVAALNGALVGAAELSFVCTLASGGRIAIDGQPGRTVVLPANGTTHRFDTFYTDNYGATMQLSATEDGTHNSGSLYTTGVTYGTNTISIDVDRNTPATLYYYSSETAGMGGKILLDFDFVGIADGSNGDGLFYHMEVRAYSLCRSESAGSV